MDWVVLSASAGAISATAGATAAIVAATALRRTREDQARRDAAGLHVSTYIAAQQYPDGEELQSDEEPSDRTDAWLVAKVTNASAHPYYAVVISTFLRSRRKRSAAVAEIVPPNSSRYARLALVDGCDAVAMDSDTLVTTTFIDSLARGWHRSSQGKLERCKIPRGWQQAELLGRRHRGAALHQIGEVTEKGPDGFEWHVARDAEGYEVDVSHLEAPASETSVDDQAFPMPRRSPRTPGVEAVHVDQRPTVSD